MEVIIQLLSSFRNTANQAYPQPLTRQLLLKLINDSLSPEESKSFDELKEILETLVIQGEVLKGTRGRYCIAPPMIIVENPNNFADLKFIGDRYYLRLAYQKLKVDKFDRVLEYPYKFSAGNLSFQDIKKSLNDCGIHLVTLEDLIEWLPEPNRPQLFELPNVDNPFFDLELDTFIRMYDPQNEYHSQLEREREVNKIDLKESCLLIQGSKKDTRYFWFEYKSKCFYELPQDIGNLTRFWIEKERNIPLKVYSDQKKEFYELNLKNVFLPYDYYKFVYQRSQPHQDNQRIRIIDLETYPLIKKAFEKLGCHLV